MSKPATIEQALEQQKKGRTLTKRERKVLKDSKRSPAVLEYRSRQFPTPPTYYYGDIDHQKNLLAQELVLQGKLLEKPDITIEKDINDSTYKMVKRIYKHYGIPMPKVVPQATLTKEENETEH